MLQQGTFEPRTVKELYPYQVEAIERISSGLDGLEDGQNLLFQLPTGGGKTVIFSEIAAHYIKVKRHKVLILTHRVELLHQTSRSLSSIGVQNKIIDRKVQELDDQTEYGCFVAMVETLNNRLTENARYLTDIGLVIVDEAHYNAFRKIFQYFDKVTILGVTATPLSSNKNLPLYENYHRLIVGQSIADLISMGYLAKPTTYTYDVNLQTLKVGIDGDFTISSLDYLYSLYHMQDKLVQAYEERSLGKKTLIFNSGIATSKRVFGLFQQKGYPVRHLDSTFSEQERKDTLDWFRTNDDAILTSVSILTTGFDEPSVETIILNRATRSLTLYHQMIGRGSRVLPNKDSFTIIDLGMNAQRLGLWEAPIDWQDVFANPRKFLEQTLYAKEEAVLEQEYILTDDVKDRLPLEQELFSFSIRDHYLERVRKGERPSKTLEFSVDNHVRLIRANAASFSEAIRLQQVLQNEIQWRLKQYTSCIAKSTENFFRWLLEDYNTKLRRALNKAYSTPPPEPFPVAEKQEDPQANAHQTPSPTAPLTDRGLENERQIPGHSPSGENGSPMHGHSDQAHAAPTDGPAQPEPPAVQDVRQILGEQAGERLASNDGKADGKDDAAPVGNHSASDPSPQLTNATGAPQWNSEASSLQDKVVRNDRSGTDQIQNDRSEDQRGGLGQYQIDRSSIDAGADDSAKDQGRKQKFTSQQTEDGAFEGPPSEDHSAAGHQPGEQKPENRPPEAGSNEGRDGRHA